MTMKHSWVCLPLLSCLGMAGFLLVPLIPLNWMILVSLLVLATHRPLFLPLLNLALVPPQTENFQFLLRNQKKSLNLERGFHDQCQKEVILKLYQNYPNDFVKLHLIYSHVKQVNGTVNPVLTLHLFTLFIYSQKALLIKVGKKFFHTWLCYL